MALRLRHLRDDERGVSLVFVGTSLLALFAATTLAIDVGMFMTARTQTQNAADAGALAGAIALALDDFDDRSAGGPAVQAATTTALENQVMSVPVSVGPGDVTFPQAPSGRFDRVAVSVYRTQDRLNPVSTLLGPLLGVPIVNISARATAEAAPATAVTCVRPFIIPDKWQENQDPQWSFNSQFERYDNKGQIIPNPDTYTYQPGRTGYDVAHLMPQGDRGRVIMLRADNGGNPAPTMYYSWKMPEDIGADYYEDNIKYCNQRRVPPGIDVQQEPGVMTGPTASGIDALIAQDPNAHWNGTRVVSPLGRSPRVFPIPLYDPDYYQANKENGRNASLRVVGFIGVFVEERVGIEVKARIVPLLGTIDPDAGAVPAGSNIMAVRLVE